MLLTYWLLLYFGTQSVQADKRVRQQTFSQPFTDAFFDSNYQEPISSIKLKHIFVLGESSSANIEQNGAGEQSLRLWDAPDSEVDGTSTENVFGLDFDSIDSIIYSSGNLPFKKPSKKVLAARRAILALARMSEHAYKPLPRKPWRDIGPGWHVNSTFGWKEKAVRGYVFSDKANENLVIAFKGTTFNFLPGGGDSTGPSDKLSDNMMFSCCCGATNGNWRQVCSCGRENNVCLKKCLVDHARAKTTYYHGAKLIFEAVKQKYPKAKTLLVGHSLGGALAGLVGHATETPAFSFEAPGERMYATRLGLIDEAEKKPYIFHYGHNADPIFLGTCNGKLSICYLGGYAMDSRCHSSVKCTFDTVKKLGWSESIFRHRMGGVVRNLLQGWADGTLDIQASCGRTHNCTDCTNWEFR